MQRTHDLHHRCPAPRANVHCAAAGKPQPAVQPPSGNLVRHRPRPPSSCAAPAAATSSYAGCNIDVARDGSLVFHFQEPIDGAGLSDQPAGADQHSADAGHQAEQLILRVPEQHAHAASDAVHAVVDDQLTAADAQHSSADAIAGEAAAAVQDLLSERHSRHTGADSRDAAINGQCVNGHARAIPAALNGSTAAHAEAHTDLQLSTTAPKPLRRLDLDATTADSLSLLAAFSDLANQGALADALAVTEALVAAKRRDVLSRLRHKHFFRAAQRRRAVDAALRFLSLLPRGATDARTYTMAVSVCAAAQDVHAALQVANMWRSTGRKPDTFLYTNVIRTCAEAGDSTAAMAEYDKMRGEGCRLDRHVFSALIAALGASVGGADVDRRMQLVLLERAFNLLDDMKDARVQPDAVVYNALVAAAGRAGQLQRAMEVVAEMEGHHCKPDAHTYSTLIGACSRAERPDMALKVYARAMASKVTSNLVVYDAAISACKSCSETVDVKEAMRIYADMQRNGVQPDERLYGSLMSVAGAAGDVNLAFSLLDEMEAEGLRPSKDAMSQLIVVCVFNDQLQRAQEVYKAMRARQQAPHMHAFNALINATGRAFRLGDVAGLVADMLAAGRRPDTFTYAALLSACQRAEEAELAFDILQLAKAQQIRVVDAHVFPLLRLCFNCMRALWRPGGYPPTTSVHALVPGTRRSAEGLALLSALQGRPRPPAEAASTAADWRARALSVYREALHGGARPSLLALDRLLACLREPRPAPTSRRAAAAAAATQPPAFRPIGTARGGHAVGGGVGGGGVAALEAPDRGVWGGFTDKAIVLLEEAISLGTLPGYKLGEGCTVDVCSMPPAVAEVYVLAVLQHLQRRRNPRVKVEHSITFLVPAFDPSAVFAPSYANGAAAGGVHAARMEGEDEVMAGLPEYAIASFDDHYIAGSTTGLGVAATLRRLRLYVEVDAAAGILFLSPRELTRWTRATSRAENNSRKPKAAAEWEPGRLMRTPIGRQAQNIRMQDAAVCAPAGTPSWQSVLQTGGSAGGDRRWSERQRERREGITPASSYDGSSYDGDVTYDGGVYAYDEASSHDDAPSRGAAGRRLDGSGGAGTSSIDFADGSVRGWQLGPAIA